jgi:hypothetical protein
VAQAALKLSPEELQAFGQPAKNGEERSALPLLKGEKVTRREAEAILHETAMREVESVLTEAAPKEAVEGSHRLIDAAVREIIEDYRPNESLIGRRFFEIKAKAEACVLEKVRKAGEEWILMADLGPAELHRIESTWSPAWENAPTPLSQCEGQAVWRCGGAAYCCGPEALEYQMVRVR